MRKNSARKWLHATLDLLPVVIIPIFALYSTNKNATFAQEITVSQNKVVDFNQLIKNGNFENTDYWREGNATLTIDQNGAVVLASNYFGFIAQDHNNVYLNHKYYFHVDVSTSVVDYSLNGGFQFATSNGELNYPLTSQSSYTWRTIETILTCSNNGLDVGFYIWDTRENNRDSIYLDDLFLIDLTQMFGVDNEPTIQQFNEWYSNDYYDYTLSDKQLLKDYDQITYNDTDIGSQFIYGLYNSVDKYFNIGNVFNLGSIYDWLNLNIFNGNAPIAIYIVWNIVAYEFLMDLLFLLYGLFMFFIDTCTNLMDRFYCTLSGRR